MNVAETVAGDYAPGAYVLEDIDPFERRDEWLAERRKGIGASDIAGVLGLSRWSSPFTVWADKVGILPDRPPTRRMKAGQFFEDGTRRWFAEETGTVVVGPAMVLQSMHVPIARCTTDGAVLGAATGELLGGLEVKFEGPGRAWDSIPLQYQCQAQWQMAVAGWPKVFFAVAHGGALEEGGGPVLDRDEKDIAVMLDLAAHFWSEHVVTGVPPTVDGSDATESAIKAIYPEHTPGERVDLGHLRDVVAAWEEAKTEATDAANREKAHRNVLLAELGDAELGEIDGIPVLSCRQQSRAGIDGDALAQDHPDLAREYATSTSFRVLRPASKKDKEQTHGRS